MATSRCLAPSRTSSSRIERPDHVLLGVPGHLDEAAVDPGVAEVGQPQDHGWRRVGGEGPLEPLLGVEALGLVVEDDRQAVGPALGVGQHHGADAVRPTGLLLAGRRHLDHHLVEGLAREHALHRVLPRRQPVAVAVAQLEALPVLGDGRAQLLHLGDAVHPERRGVGPRDGLVRLDQDHPVVQRRDELLELAVVGAVARHWVFGQQILQTCKALRGTRRGRTAGWRTAAWIVLPKSEGSSGAGLLGRTPAPR
jgi:hypothetical protein